MSSSDTSERFNVARSPCRASKQRLIASDRCWSSSTAEPTITTASCDLCLKSWKLTSDTAAPYRLASSALRLLNSFLLLFKDVL